MIANLASLLLGKTVINLNYTASLQTLKSAIGKAEIRSLYKQVSRPIEPSPTEPRP